MPKNPFASRVVTQEEARFEKRLRESDFSEERKTEFRAKFAARQKAERKAEVNRLAAIEQRAQAGSGFRQAGAEFTAAGLHLLDSAALGHLPQIVDAVPFTGDLGEKAELALDVSEQTNPIGATVGDIGGFFTGAAGKVAKGASRGVDAALGSSILRLTEQGAGFTARAAAHIMSNLAGGAAATGATRLLEDREDDGDLGLRINAIANDITNPWSIGLSAGLGVVSAKLASAGRKDIARIARKYEEATGEKLPFDVLTDKESIRQIRQLTQKLPGFADDVHRLQKRQTDVLVALVDDIERKVKGAGTKASAKGNAAKRIRRLRETVTDERRGIESAALVKEGPLRQASSDAIARLRSGLINVKKNNPAGEEARGFDKVLSRVIRLTSDKKGRPTRRPTVAELESIRKQTAKIAYTKNQMNPLDPRFSDASRKQARDFYHVIDTVIEQEAPHFSKALKTGERLRRIEEALPDEILKADIDDVALGMFWKQANVNRRWEALVQRGTPEEIGAAKGYLFEDLIANVVDKNGLLDADKLKAAMRSSKHNKQLLDKVMPGVADELLDLSKLTKVMKETSLKQAEVGPSAFVTMGLAFAAPTLLTKAIANPMSIIPTALGNFGVAVALHRANRHFVFGSGQESLRRLATGEHRAVGRASAALAGTLNDQRSPKP